MEFNDKPRIESRFYDDLLSILSEKKINYTFKLAISMLGHPYISWSSISRTLSWQPSLINLLSYGPVKADNPNGLHELGDTIGVYIYRKLGDMQEREREKARETIAHNLIMLCGSYGLDRHDEVYCIRTIARRIMTQTEYDRLITGK